jgi:hypothetical protein
VNPYILFSQEQRSLMKQSGKLESLQAKEVLKEIGKLWNALDEPGKAIWKDKAQKLTDANQNADSNSGVVVAEA